MSRPLRCGLLSPLVVTTRPLPQAAGISAPPHARGWAGDDRQLAAEIARIEVLDFEKPGVFTGRFVDPEMAHDAEGRRAFERAAKGRARDREIGLGCPARKLRRS